jgi:hypothetical protein
MTQKLMGIDCLRFVDNDNSDVFAGDLRLLFASLVDDELIVSE